MFGNSGVWKSADRQAMVIKIIRLFLSPSRQILRWYLKVYNTWFLPSFIMTLTLHTYALHNALLAAYSLCPASPTDDMTQTINSIKTNISRIATKHLQTWAQWTSVTDWQFPGQISYYQFLEKDTASWSWLLRKVCDDGIRVLNFLDITNRPVIYLKPFRRLDSVLNLRTERDESPKRF
jgi:hypothetical protein